MRIGALALACVAIIVAAGLALWPSHDAPTREATGTTRALSTASDVGTVPTAPAASDAKQSDAASNGIVDDEYLTYAPTPASSDATPVEVPSVVGRTAADARMLLAAADLRVQCVSTTESGTVTSQDPKAGGIAAAGSTVTLALLSQPKPAAKARALPTVVVCIDPGHQSRSNNAKEPIGPGSKTLKAKVTGGGTGVKTRVPEYEVALEIATNVRARLKKAGIKVVMTRTTNDVNLSNAQRAQIANRAHAALFLRIHANGSSDARKAGLSTLYPAPSKWTRSTTTASKRAATLAQRAVLASTGAANDGLHARSDLAGFNWCTRPSILIECGYLSNPIEDRLLTSPKYQDKVAAGITAGVLRYLGR